MNRTPALIAAVLTLSAVAAAPAAPRLRYRLEVGDRLAYTRTAITSDTGTGQPLHQTRDQIQVWCLARDEKELLVLVDLLRTADDVAAPLTAVLFYIDDAGRRRLPPETVTRIGALDPALDALPALPVGAQLEAAWGSPVDVYDRRWRCTARGADPQAHGHLRVEFRLDDAPGVAELLGQTRSGQFWFDGDAGLLARLEATEEDLTSATRTRVSLELAERTRETADWCSKRTGEATRYLRTLGHEDRLLQALVTQPTDTARIEPQLTQLWTAFKSDIEARAQSPFAAVAEGRQRQLRDQTAALDARGDLARRWLLRRAGTWTLQTAHGETVTCESARKGILVECFWSSESATGFRTFDTLRRLPQALQPFPVEVIYYNLDRRLDRARDAILRYGGSRRHLMAAPLLEVEAFPELPAVRVLDHNSIVRGLWVGWQPSYAPATELAEELASQLRH